jgi:lipoprotein-anchoring transpeptidase ErfK/SrfK
MNGVRDSRTWTAQSGWAAAVLALLAVTASVEVSQSATPAPRPQASAQSRSLRTHTFPTPPQNSGTGRRIIFDQSDQRVWLVAPDETVLRSYLVSGSNRDNVHAGTYVVTSRTRHARAYKGDGTFEYFVQFTEGHNAPIGFHSVTVDSTGHYVHARADLGTPRTPGCVQQWPDDAAALWAFAPTGTRVNVVP